MKKHNLKLSLLYGFIGSVVFITIFKLLFEKINGFISFYYADLYVLIIVQLFICFELIEARISSYFASKRILKYVFYFSLIFTFFKLQEYLLFKIKI